MKEFTAKEIVSGFYILLWIGRGYRAVEVDTHSSGVAPVYRQYAVLGAYGVSLKADRVSAS